jgi:hypothetical protein
LKGVAIVQLPAKRVDEKYNGYNIKFTWLPVLFGADAGVVIKRGNAA